MNNFLLMSKCPHCSFIPSSYIMHDDYVIMNHVPNVKAIYRFNKTTYYLHHIKRVYVERMTK